LQGTTDAAVFAVNQTHYLAEDWDKPREKASVELK
jgi:hypothetical protein